MNLLTASQSIRMTLPHLSSLDHLDAYGYYGMLHRTIINILFHSIFRYIAIILSIESSLKKIM